jgi:hypothetical protein
MVGYPGVCLRIDPSDSPNDASCITAFASLLPAAVAA